MGTKNYRFNAFTLVELLIVVAIIAILAAVAVTYLRGQTFKGTNEKRKAEINRIKIAVEEYEKDHNCYPPPQLLTCNPGTGLKPYIDRIPCDPITNAPYLYDYQNSACPSWYRFYTKLQFSADPLATPNIGPNFAFNYVVGSANAPASVPGGATAPPGGGGGGGAQMLNIMDVDQEPVCRLVGMQIGLGPSVIQGSQM